MCQAAQMFGHDQGRFWGSLGIVDRRVVELTSVDSEKGEIGLDFHHQHQGEGELRSGSRGDWIRRRRIPDKFGNI